MPSKQSLHLLITNKKYSYIVHDEYAARQVL